MRRAIDKYIGLIVILVLLILRFVALEVDPPLFHIGHGQAELTDPYHLTYSARNAVLYGDWNPFDYYRWDVFKNSLISGASFLLFSIFAVSRVTANLSAVVLQTSGFLFFLLGFFDFRGRREIILVAVFLLFNSTLFFYGRLPFLENGLIFLSGLTFFVSVRFHERAWGQLLSGALVALAALSGKLFGFILIGPAVLTIIYRYRSRAAVPILFTLAGSISGAVLYLLVFFGGGVSTLISYYSEQTVGMYGPPPGFTSPINFFKMFVTFGGESGLTEYTPFLILLAGISLFFVITTLPFAGKFKKEYVPVVFSAGWLICGVAGLMPFQYRPLRYGLFLYLPVSAICAYAIRYAFEDKIRIELHSKWMTLPIIFFVCWYLFTQVAVFFAPFGQKFRSGVAVMPVTALGTLFITGAMYLWLHKRPRNMSRRATLLILSVILVAFAIRQGTYLYQGLVYPGKYMKQYNTELSWLVDGDAIVTGPYTPALTIDNQLKGVIYVFGLANVQEDLFDRFPVTHIASDNSNWKRAVKDFPFLNSAIRIVQMAIRDRVIDIYRLPDADVPPTDFERGSMFLAEGRWDSANVYYERFSDKYPESFFGRMHRVVALSAAGATGEALNLLNDLLAEQPDNYTLHAFCKGFYRNLFNGTGDRMFLRRSQHHEQREKELKQRF